MLLDLLAGAAGGGVLGIAGAAFKTWSTYKEHKLVLGHELLMADKITANVRAEAELARLKQELDMEITDSIEDAKSLRAAIEAESSVTGTSQYVTDMRGMVRPVLTFLLVGIAAINPTPDFIFLATTAVTFWFGDRPRSSK